MSNEHQQNSSGDPSPPEQQPKATPPPASGRLFSPTAMVIATLIGSLAAGVYMLFANYRVLGYPRLAMRIAIIGWIFYALLIAATGLLPQGSLIWAVVFGILQAGIAYVASNALQGDAIAYHQQRGGSMHSNWTAVSVGLLAVLVLVLLLAIMGQLAGGGAAAG